MKPTALTCMRDAREAVHKAYRKANAFQPRASSYGTSNHAVRLKYDRAVHDEFAKRVKAAGLYVEGL